MRSRLDPLRNFGKGRAHCAFTPRRSGLSQATKHYPIERYECPAAKQGKTTDELCAGAFRGRVQSDEFIELANLTLGSGGADEVAELEFKAANEKGSAKLLGEQSI